MKYANLDMLETGLGCGGRFSRKGPRAAASRFPELEHAVGSGATARPLLGTIAAIQQWIWSEQGGVPT